jgi:hypothetical protein
MWPRQEFSKTNNPSCGTKPSKCTQSFIFTFLSIKKPQFTELSREFALYPEADHYKKYYFIAFSNEKR